MIQSDIYRNVFFSREVHKVLMRGSIISPEGDARSLVASLLRRLEAAELGLNEPPRSTAAVLSELEYLIGAGVCTLGSPLLTNVAFSHPTLSSCGAVSLPAGLFSSAHADAAASYYRLNMGSGYNLNEARDPVALLYQLNEHAMELTRTNRCERYIGNIAHLSVHHPRIRQFITAKLNRRDVVHFNISVDVSPSFMAAVEADQEYSLMNGASVSARLMWDALVHSAWMCGDPGLICLDRYNADNAVAEQSPYVTTAPCAEVGLAAGETCVFGYINVAACLTESAGELHLDDELVERATRCLTRVLDDAVEESVSGSPNAITASVMRLTRKIGIGLCGYADALLLMGLDYGSDEGTAVLNRTLSLINHASKHSSMELAARRGSFGAFEASRYRTEPGFLTRTAQRATAPGMGAWQGLEREVARWGLRNAMTTALPPSGRSSILLGVNSSIEPYLTFAPSDHSPLLLRLLTQRGMLVTRPGGSVLSARAPAEPHLPARWSLFRKASEITPTEHLAVLLEAAALADDGVSKTVNLNQDASEADVGEIYLRAWRGGLKAISVYRELGLGASVPARAA